MSNAGGQLNSHWEAQINALLDGELDAAGIAELEEAVKHEPELAQALTDALQLQQLLGDMPKLAAPARLQRKLLSIPGAESAHWTQWSWLRGGVALACLALVMVVGNLGGPEQPSAAEIEQGRRDLALALSYLSDASAKTNMQIDRRLEGAMVDPVTQITMDTLRKQFDLQQEYSL